MRRLVSIIVGTLFLLLVATCIWGYGYIRRVDSRSPAQWLAFADQASRTVAYHAEGSSLSNGMRATFILDQDSGGRYAMTTRDTRGRLCSLGYDGDQLWYSAGNKQEKMAVSAATDKPLPEHAKIIGLATIAGRKAVRLFLISGHLEKRLAIDRKTGVVLSMTTRVRRQPVSEMKIKQISYRAVIVPICNMACCTQARSVDRPTLERALGSKVLEPRWLPAGYVLTDMLLESCAECGNPMGVLRYSDGIGDVTLFEMSQRDKLCSMGEACRPAATDEMLVVSKTSGAFSITAVADLDAHTLQRVLNSIK